jgi:hypothetical protein
VVDNIKNYSLLRYEIIYNRKKFYIIKSIVADITRLLKTILGTFVKFLKTP